MKEGLKMQKKPKKASKPRQEKRRTGSTSGIVTDKSLEKLPDWLHPLFVDWAIREELFFAGRLDDADKVKKQRVETGVKWWIEEKGAFA